MIIRDDEMSKKMGRALAISGNLCTLDDIYQQMLKGNFQGHVEGDTWAVTQVYDWPQKRVVNIMYVIGSVDNAVALETKITEWARGVGAKMITAVGRDGWWNFRTPGWNKVGVLYAKDIGP